MSWQRVLAALAATMVAALIACVGPTATAPTIKSMAASPPPDPAAVKRGEYLFNRCHRRRLYSGIPGRSGADQHGVYPAHT